MSFDFGLALNITAFVPKIIVVSYLVVSSVISFYDYLYLFQSIAHNGLKKPRKLFKSGRFFSIVGRILKKTFYPFSFFKVA